MAYIIICSDGVRPYASLASPHVFVQAHFRLVRYISLKISRNSIRGGSEAFPKTIIIPHSG